MKGYEFKEPQTKAKGLVAVVTGCSGGIGKQIARELNNKGAKVHILCRNHASGDEARKHLVMVRCYCDESCEQHCFFSSKAPISSVSSFTRAISHHSTPFARALMRLSKVSEEYSMKEVVMSILLCRRGQSGYSGEQCWHYALPEVPAHRRWT